MGAALTKLDVGTYTYPAAGAPQPHGVASITGTPGTTSFAYDSDGNVTAETGATTRSLGWTMFNMPATISYGSKTISFQYDADHNRVMQTAPSGTTYYLPDGEQTPGASTGPVWHTYFQADGERVVEDFGPTGSLKHHFFHNDYQNTIGLVTDDTFTEAGWPSGTGIVQNELSDVFGQPRLHTGANDPNWGAADVTKRRYINQEDLTPVQLINLNARIYDPLLGKFMSPDPVISDRDDSQSWNAYSYVQNNPMSQEDASGLDACPPNTVCVGMKFSPPPGPAPAPGPSPALNPQPTHNLPQLGNNQYDPESQGTADASAVGRSAADYAAHTPSQPGRTIPNSMGVIQRPYSGARLVASATAGAIASVASKVGSTAEAIAVTVEDSFDEGGLGNDLVHTLDAFPAENFAEQVIVKGGEEAAEGAEVAEAIIHGNSKLSQKVAYLYKLFTQDGEFLKNGVTQDLEKRYTKGFMANKTIVPVRKGARIDMLARSLSW